MKINLGRIIITASAGAALLLTLDKIGVTPLAPGYDVGLQWNMDLAGRRLTLTTDAGDLECWVRLKVPAGASDRPSPKAFMSDGHKLSVVRDSEWFEIFDPDDEPSKRMKFHWLSGTRLNVEFTGGTSPLALDDWIVYLKDKSFDSYGRAKWRKWWFRIWIGLLGLTVVGAVVGRALDKKETPAFTPETCLTQLIASVEGRTPQETERMRSLLRKVVLEGSSPSSVLAAFNLRQADRWAIWFRARAEFLKRLDYLINGLSRYYSTIAR